MWKAELESNETGYFPEEILSKVLMEWPGSSSPLMVKCEEREIIIRQNCQAKKKKEVELKGLENEKLFLEEDTKGIAK